MVVVIHATEGNITRKLQSWLVEVVIPQNSMYASLRVLPPDGDYPTPNGAGGENSRLDMLSNAVRLRGVRVLLQMFKKDGALRSMSADHAPSCVLFVRFRMAGWLPRHVMLR